MFKRTIEEAPMVFDEDISDPELFDPQTNSKDSTEEISDTELDEILSSMNISNSFGSQVEVQPNQEVIQQERLLYIDWVRAMSVLYMVFVNVVQQLPCSAANAPEWLCERKDGFIKVSCVFGVYIFFYISGIAQASNREDLWTYVKKRSARLLLPMLLVIPFLLWQTSFSSGLAVLNNLHWLMFLPALFSVDLLNYAPARVMRILLDCAGGWRKAGQDCRDLVPAIMVKLFYLVSTGWVWPVLIPYHIALGVAELSVCLGVWMFAMTKQYPIWFITCWILPMVTVMLAFHWPSEENGEEPAGSVFITLNIFTIFALQGRLEQMVLPYWHKFKEVGGKNYGLYKIVQAFRFTWVVFLCAFSFPTTGHEDRNNRIAQFPMYRREPELAFLGQVATWVALKLVLGIANGYYNEVIHEELFLHITQAPLIIYLFHMPLIVLSFAINDRLSPGVSFVYMFVVDTTFVCVGSCMIYYLLLQLPTRTFFGLKNVCSKGYERSQHSSGSRLEAKNRTGLFCL